jgi:hypothetical protein
MSGFFGLPFNGVLYRLVGANMNATTDQALVRMHGFTAYEINNIYALNPSGSCASAVGGIYTAAAKGGTAVVAASQAYSTLSGTGTNLILTTATAGRNRRTEDLILSLTTPHGSAATCDIYVFGFGVL